MERSEAKKAWWMSRRDFLQAAGFSLSGSALPAGGCRSNIEMTINEVDDVCQVKGMHQIIFYGNHAKQLRAFCQLYGIEVVT